MKKILSAIMITSILFTSCKKESTEIVKDTPGKLDVKFDAIFGHQDFALNTDLTIGTKTFKFNKFRYWVSNVILVKTNGEEYNVPKSYYLLEETSAVAVQDGDYTYPANKRELVELSDIPAGEYKAIKFGIGVESKYNDNLSLQIGELSQLNGMTNVSWMWHTSYIFTAIGGTATENAVAKTIKIETGLNTNYRTVTLNFPQNLSIGSAKSTAIDIKADVAKALDGIDVMATPTVGAAQASTMTALANNYAAKVFSVSSVK
jgi:hypothetical protein